MPTTEYLYFFNGKMPKHIIKTQMEKLQLNTIEYLSYIILNKSKQNGTNTPYNPHYNNNNNNDLYD